MDPIIILQFITIALSVISIFTNTYITINENRKRNFLELTTKHRLANMLDTRKKVATILTLTAPLTIMEIKRNADTTYIRNILQVSLEFELIFKVIYEEEHEIMLIAQNLVRNAVKFYENNIPDIGKLIEEDRNKLKILFSIYDTTDWEFIKEQTKGKLFDNKEWLKKYEEYKDKFISIENIT
jgi:light-regulated signal transduction histidine kinase (bacteriophytochrome)